MTSMNLEYISRYCEAKGKSPLISNSIFFIPKILFSKKKTILISDNRILRGFAKLRRREFIRLSTASEISVQFFAMQDMLKILSQKGVSVYFYNRIGKEKEGFTYSESEKRRMRDKLSFPKMYQNIDKYENELKEVFGSLYARDYVEEIGKIPQVIKVGNIYQHESKNSKLINVENGKRITVYQPKAYSRTMHVYGRCGVFGYAVEDKDCLPSLLQKELVDHGVDDIKVVNHGLWGGEDYCVDHNFLQDAVGFKSGDIVLFYRKHFDKKLLAELEKCGLIYKEITREWHEKKDEAVTFFDRPGHMNAEGYKLTAKLVCEDLLNTGISDFHCDKNIDVGEARDLNYYLKTRANNDFSNEIDAYVKEILNEYPIDENKTNNGAIVMNCNPFTYGHRYLIEKAAEQVDRLYIFVVEEDKSFFQFNDRFEMVKNGTKDIKNVVVVPSGKFIISAYTFPEYFMKDYVKNKNFDVSLDVETFCKYIAPPLNIKVRFAGEEPFDPVTKNYNENMKRILPEHGLEFVEIQRFSAGNGQVINATKVRELLKDKKTEELKEYVPQSTFDVLMEKYMGEN